MIKRDYGQDGSQKIWKLTLALLLCHYPYYKLTHGEEAELLLSGLGCDFNQVKVKGRQ